MKKTKILFLLLAIVMTASVFAGCNGTGGDDGGTTTTPATTTSKPSDGSSTTSEPVTTTEAGIDFGGYEFYLGHAHARFKLEGAPTTALQEELLEIYTEIEEKYNCLIKFVDPGNKADVLLTAAVSGTKLADFIRVKQDAWIPLFMQNGIRALDSDEMLAAGLEVNNPENFYQHYTQLTKMNGNIWACDMSGKFDYMAFGHCYGFNKTLTANAGYPAEMLFDAVRNMEWTYDYMITVAKAITADTDGDHVNDIWGIALDCDGNEIWSNGTGPIVQNSEGKWVSNVSDQRVIKAMDFMNRVTGDKDVQMPVDITNRLRGERRTMFYESKAGFAGLYGPNFGDDTATGILGDVAGLLPIPKGPDVDHYTMNMVDVDNYICQTSNQDWAISAFIMNEIGKRLTSEEGYAEAMLARLFGCEDSFEMLFDYLLPYSLMNIAKCSADMHSILRNQMYDYVYVGTTTPAGAAEEFDAVIQAELDKVFRQ